MSAAATRAARVRRRIGVVVPPLVWGALFLFAWERFVAVRKIKPFLLPAPSAIWDRLSDSGFRSGVIDTAKVTGINALIGLVLGVAAAVALALAAQRFRALAELIRPLSAAMNTMPIVALGPVFYNLFGSTSEGARRTVVALVAFFPVFVNTLKGLTQVDPVHQELMRSYAAADRDVLRLVRLPNALPFLLTGVRLAASMAVIAAVVVEYFGGKQNGLGSRTASAMKQSLTANAWAYITAACLLGLTFYVLALLGERLAMPWQARRRSAERA
jgi:NitT/TauT family transport system permease protein